MLTKVRKTRNIFYIRVKQICIWSCFSGIIQLLLKGTNCTFLRYLHARIEWEDRLIGIFGSRGVGKTTLLLQHIKLKFEDSREALYVNLDDFWFETHSLTRCG